MVQSLQGLPLRAVSHSWLVQSSDGSENHVRHVADLPERSCTMPKYSQQVSINNTRVHKSLKWYQAAAAIFWPLSQCIQVRKHRKWHAISGSMKLLTFKPCINQALMERLIRSQNDSMLYYSCIFYDRVATQWWRHDILMDQRDSAQLIDKTNPTLVWTSVGHRPALISGQSKGLEMEGRSLSFHCSFHMCFFMHLRYEHGGFYNRILQISLFGLSKWQLRIKRHSHERQFLSCILITAML